MVFIVVFMPLPHGGKGLSVISDFDFGISCSYTLVFVPDSCLPLGPQWFQINGFILSRHLSNRVDAQAVITGFCMTRLII